MNTVQFGLEREKNIIGVFLLTPFLSTSLVKLEFGGVSDRMVQRVLKRMVERQMLSRFRYGQEYIYHVIPKNQKWRHHLEVARFHYAFIGSLANWQEILEYEFEKVVGSAVADIYYKMIYKPDDIREFYVEVDMGSHRVNFDKYPSHYTVVFTTPQKVKPPANWIKTTIEKVRKYGIRLGSENRKVDDTWFQGVSKKTEEEVTRNAFFQQGKSIR